MNTMVGGWYEARQDLIQGGAPGQYSAPMVSDLLLDPYQTSVGDLTMPELVVFYVKDHKLETDQGQGMVWMNLGPMGIKEARALAAVAALGKLKVILE